MSATIQPVQDLRQLEQHRLLEQQARHDLVNRLISHLYVMNLKPDWDSADFLPNQDYLDKLHVFARNGAFRIAKDVYHLSVTVEDNPSPVKEFEG